MLGARAGNFRLSVPLTNQDNSPLDVRFSVAVPLSGSGLLFETPFSVVSVHQILRNLRGCRFLLQLLPLLSGNTERRRSFEIFIWLRTEGPDIGPVPR